MKDLSVREAKAVSLHAYIKTLKTILLSKPNLTWKNFLRQIESWLSKELHSYGRLAITKTGHEGVNR